MKHKNKPEAQRIIALERINSLFKEAKTTFREQPELSNRYVQLARKLSMKYKVKLPSELKRAFCKHCNTYLVPSKNCRVRIQHRKVIYCCANCKGFMRFPLIKKKQSVQKVARRASERLKDVLRKTSKL